MTAAIQKAALYAIGVAQLALALLSFRRGWEVGLLLTLLLVHVAVALHHALRVSEQAIRHMKMTHDLSKLVVDHMQAHVDFGRALREAREQRWQKKAAGQARTVN